MSRRRTATAVAFTITAVCIGVFIWSLSPGMAQSEEREKELQELAKKSQAAVTKITGLQFKSDVKIGVKPRADLKEMMMKQLNEEVPEQEMKDMHKALVKFRLLPADMDLGKFFVNMYTAAVEGFYDPETKELYLIGDKEQKKPETAEEKMMELNKNMMEMMFGVKYDEMLLVHELTHAAQDQNFDMQTLPMEGQENDDLVTAVKSVVEGEATYSMFEHLFKKMGGVDRVGDMGKMLANDPLTGGAGMQDAPEYIRQGMIFPYAKGFTFVQKLKKYAISQAPGQNSEEVAWAAIHKLFSDLPSSTEQFLHPKKYFETRDNPTIVTLPDLSEVLGKEWRLLLSNVHGELNTGILLKAVLKETNIIKARNGWDGDRFAVFEKKDNPNVLAVWFTTWDTPQDAQEFFQLYGELIPAKYKEAGMLKIFEPGVNRWTTEEGGVLVEIRDSDVLVLEGTDGSFDEKLRETLWKNTKKEELKAVKRIEPKKKEDKVGEKNTPAGGAKQNCVLSVSCTVAGKTVKVEVSLPDASWKNDHSDETSVDLTCSNSPTVARIALMPREGTIEDVRNKVIEHFKEAMEGFENGPSKPVKAAGLSGIEFTASGTPKDVGRKMHMRVLVLEHEDAFAGIICTTSAETFDECAKDCQNLMDNLRITR